MSLTTPPPALIPALTEFLLALADDKFFLGHLDSDWTGLAPLLEEDIAFSSLSQDEIGHASAIYQLIATWDGRSADRIAFGRAPGEYRCASITTIEDDFDWATAIARRWFCDHFDALRLERLRGSSLAPLKALATRMAAEERVHTEHSDAWIVRLGKGNADSRARLQAAVDRLCVPATDLFEPTAGAEQLEAAGLISAEPRLFERWKESLERVAAAGGISVRVLPRAASAPPAGRAGRHQPGFAAVHAELSEVFQLEPDGAW
ncbi:MAG: phenylacetate-CoA oxygenase subunit PaaC [Phycisphaerales bacterium]|nr:phenylacetate-CoA oxygenase subunit PaaC [Phycisphaerales bacterium]